MAVKWKIFLLFSLILGFIFPLFKVSAQCGNDTCEFSWYCLSTPFFTCKNVDFGKKCVGKALCQGTGKECDCPWCYCKVPGQCRVKWELVEECNDVCSIIYPCRRRQRNCDKDAAGNLRCLSTGYYYPDDTCNELCVSTPATCENEVLKKNFNCSGGNCIPFYVEDCNAKDGCIAWGNGCRMVDYYCDASSGSCKAQYSDPKYDYWGNEYPCCSGNQSCTCRDFYDCGCYNNSCTCQKTQTQYSNCSYVCDQCGYCPGSFCPNYCDYQNHKLCVGISGCCSCSYSCDYNPDCNRAPAASNPTSTVYCCWRTSPQVAKGLSVVLSWNYSDPDGDQSDGYEVWVDTVPNFHDGDPRFKYKKEGIQSTAYSLNLDDNQSTRPDKLTYPLSWNTRYYWKVRVKDELGEWSDWSNTTYFDTPKHAYPYVDFDWQPKRPRVGEIVQFTDLSECYDASDNVTSCSSWYWTFQNGNPANSNEQNPTTTFTSVGANEVTLKVTKDGLDCSYSKTVNSTYPLPFWKEIPPIFFKMRDFFASLISKFKPF